MKDAFSGYNKSTFTSQIFHRIQYICETVVFVIKIIVNNQGPLVFLEELNMSITSFSFYKINAWLSAIFRAILGFICGTIFNPVMFNINMTEIIQPKVQSVFGFFINDEKDLDIINCMNET
uniref:Uncharacterized protein n=1 Tax=Cacopsylla melanoneura TaxID=428564 RepID=A0A8D9AQ44_9HEMI